MVALQLLLVITDQGGMGWKAESPHAIAFDEVIRADVTQNTGESCSQVTNCLIFTLSLVSHHCTVLL